MNMKNKIYKKSGAISYRFKNLSHIAIIKYNILSEHDFGIFILVDDILIFC